jgi:hypothetical protein
VCQEIYEIGASRHRFKFQLTIMERVEDACCLCRFRAAGSRCCPGGGHSQGQPLELQSALARTTFRQRCLQGQLHMRCSTMKRKSHWKNVHSPVQHRSTFVETSGTFVCDAEVTDKLCRHLLKILGSLSLWLCSPGQLCSGVWLSPSQQFTEMCTRRGTWCSRQQIQLPFGVGRARGRCHCDCLSICWKLEMDLCLH